MNKTAHKVQGSVQEVAELLKKDGNVVFAVLFGSAATGRAKPDSDLDIGIFFKRPPAGLKLLRFINILSNAAGRDVHIAVLNSASAFLRHQVMKNRVVLAKKDETAYTKFREKTISDYQEYKYISGMDIYDRQAVG